jgi:Flp pilus assembly protein TadB
MDSPEYNLLISLALIPVVFMLQIWVRQRRLRRRNESGQQEFDSLGATVVSALAEGVAVISSLVLVIWIMGAVLRYLFPVIFNAQ